MTNFENKLRKIIAECSNDAESAVLGSIILDSKTFWPKAYEILTPEHFINLNNRFVFNACLNLYSRGVYIDFVTLSNEIPKTMSKQEFKENFNSKKEMKNLLLNYSEIVPSLSNFGNYISIMLEKFELSKLAALGDKINNAVESNENPKDICHFINEEICEKIKEKKNEPKLFLECLYDTLSYISKPADKNRVFSGLKDIDDIVQGFSKGNLIVLAARPGMGKTSLALRIARNVAETKKVMFFSLEMTCHELSTKLVSMESGIPLKILNEGNVPDDIWKKAFLSFKNINSVGANLMIDDSSSMTVSKIRNKIKANENIDLIIIDYLHLLTIESPTGNVLNDLSTLSGNLKSLAKELDIPIICLSQLSRNCEQRANHRPNLSDLRGSGSIEQDADIVIMLYREDYYITREEFIKGKQYTNSCECIIAKNRHGATGSAIITWNPKSTNFK